MSIMLSPFALNDAISSSALKFASGKFPCTRDGNETLPSFLPLRTVHVGPFAYMEIGI